MRVAHLDTRKCSSIDASRSRDAPTQRKSSSAQVTVHGPDRLCCSQSEPRKGAEAEYKGVRDAGDIDTTGCMPIERNIKSAGGTLGFRDANSQRGEVRPTTRNEVDTLSSVFKDGNNATTTATLIRNPFSPGKRRRLTTSTTQYLRWASSSSIVHDTR